MDTVVTVLMVVYYIFSLSQSIPCIVKLARTKKSNDYSLLNRLLQYLALLFLTAAILIGNNKPVVKIIGYIDLLALTIENILILRFYKFKNKGN